MEELLTVEQVIAEIEEIGSKIVINAVKKRFKIDGTLPLHAIKQDLGLIPVTRYLRVAKKSD